LEEVRHDVFQEICNIRNATHIIADRFKTVTPADFEKLNAFAKEICAFANEINERNMKNRNTLTTKGENIESSTDTK